MHIFGQPNTFLAAGVNFFDNAEMYGDTSQGWGKGGVSEVVMGEAVQIGLKEGERSLGVDVRVILTQPCIFCMDNPYNDFIHITHLKYTVWC